MTTKVIDEKVTLVQEDVGKLTWELRNLSEDMKKLAAQSEKQTGKIR